MVSHDALADPLCLLAMPRQRLRILHFAVTQHPTTEKTTRQLLEAFPSDTAPRLLLRVVTVFLEMSLR